MENEENQAVDLENNDVVETAEADINQTLAEKEAEIAKWKAIAQRNKTRANKQLTTKEESVDETFKNDIQSLKQAEAKRQYAYQHSLSPDETDAIFKVNPNPNEETLKDPFIMGGIEKIRSQKRVEANTPSSSVSSSSFGGKKWDEMDESERKNNYGELLKQLDKNVRRR